MSEEVQTKPTCAGPVRLTDQGIEVCTTCGSCICCSYLRVDHSNAAYECFTDEFGLCHLRLHEGLECTRMRPVLP